jgi:hypothetical protein
MLQVHAKVDKVVRRGVKAITKIAAGGRDCIEVLVAQGARAVLEVIEADPDIPVKTHNAVRVALAVLA